MICMQPCFSHCLEPGFSACPCMPLRGCMRGCMHGCSMQRRLGFLDVNVNTLCDSPVIEDGTPTHVLL